MTAITRLSLSPLVQSAILSSPRSKERAVKGSEMLATGKVQRLADAPAGVDRWLVYGSGDQPYRVSIAGGTCDCPDRAQTCKHLHACLLKCTRQNNGIFVCLTPTCSHLQSDWHIARRTSRNDSFNNRQG